MRLWIVTLVAPSGDEFLQKVRAKSAERAEICANVWYNPTRNCCAVSVRIATFVEAARSA